MTGNVRVTLLKRYSALVTRALFYFFLINIKKCALFNSTFAVNKISQRKTHGQRKSWSIISMTGWEKPWRSSNVTEEWWWTAKVVQTPGASAEEKKSVEHKSYHWTAFLIPTHRALRVVPIPPDPNDRFPVPVPQLGWSWIGIGSSDCEPAGGCRLAQSECRFNGAQRRVSQPVGPFRVWAALCICALFHSLAQTEARGPP